MSFKGYQGQVNSKSGMKFQGHKRGGSDDAVDTGITRADS